MTTPPPAPGPPHPQGWPPYPYPYPAPPAPLNGLAVAALVTSLMCAFPVGFVLGLVALRQIRRTGERGRGMALAGVWVAAAQIVLTLGVIARIAGAGGPAGPERDETGRVTYPSEVGVYSLQAGDCFDFWSDTTDEVFTVRITPCSDPHEAEAFGTFDLPGGPFPGDDRVGELAEQRCGELGAEYAMDAWSLPYDVYLSYLSPDEVSWRQGDREVLCTYARWDGLLDASVRSDLSTMDVHQVRYLHALNPVDAAFEAEPTSGTLPETRRWAERTAREMSQAAAELDDAGWPHEAREAVTSLREELEAGAGHFARAADAAGEPAFWEAYEAGYGHLGHEQAVAARDALGLATEPPGGWGAEAGDEDTTEV
ncbi:DUF4190 domain-containing protein [Streptomyces sp. TRM 70351]|uniref:DUF4190 domain-containing protein n=1 Tax=Streptomyces sp. TRM 70351 TaxID=3116552 RepID=UPI002E7ABEFC|nr:DUF4190 domain-containing protein [Streptomyces sp. TRM 70351]MEE1928736.1 DUF4190 domain-containing protein [Streptomyces sp. TRM 70351]